MKIHYTRKSNPLTQAVKDTQADIEFKIEVCKLTIVEELLQFMKRAGIKRTELAERLNVPPSRITKMLSGESNLTIDTLVRAGHAVGADLAQTFVPKDQKGHWTARPKVRFGKSNCIHVDFFPTEIPRATTPKLPDSKTASHDAEEAA